MGKSLLSRDSTTFPPALTLYRKTRKPIAKAFEKVGSLGRGRCSSRFFFTSCPACFHGCGELRATLRSKTAFFLRSSFLCCCRLGCWRWRGFLAFDLSPPRFGGGGDLCARSGAHRAAACSFLRGSCWARSRAGAAEKLVEFVLEIFNLLVDVDSFLERLK